MQWYLDSRSHHVNHDMWQNLLSYHCGTFLTTMIFMFYSPGARADILQQSSWYTGSELWRQGKLGELTRSLHRSIELGSLSEVSGIPTPTTSTATTTCCDFMIGNLVRGIFQSSWVDSTCSKLINNWRGEDQETDLVSVKLNTWHLVIISLQRSLFPPYNFTDIT